MSKVRSTQSYSSDIKDLLKSSDALLIGVRAPFTLHRRLPDCTSCYRKVKSSFLER